MYPEGWLMDPEGDNLIFFEKDPMNPKYEGYIGIWSVTGIGAKQFRYKKRASIAKAIARWSCLANQGWRVVEEVVKAA